MLSIVIPCYRHNKELETRSVPSALGQDYDGEYEVIVVDDCSPEPVQNLWGDRVTVIRHSANQGVSAAMNTGVRASHGDRFVICAADDELAPAFLSTMSQYDADIVSCDMRVNAEHIKCRAGSLELLKRHNCHSYAGLVKRELFDKVGGFKIKMNPSWDDYEFWLNCAKNNAVWYHVPQPLHIYHRNPTGRDEIAQGKDILLRGKMEGYHNDVFGVGRGWVTFVIPCYNQEKYLAEAVQSVLDQEYPHVNVIVVDDGSPGDVAAALEGIAYPDTSAQYPNPATALREVALIRQKNQGLSAARNAGIRLAQRNIGSQYLVMLDADDVVDPLFVENTLGALSPSKQFIYTDIQFIGDAWHTYELEEFDCRRLVNKHLHPCTFLARSDMYQAVKDKRGYYYDEDMKEGYEDWEFAIAAVEVGYSGARLPEHLFRYRYHKDGSMRTEAKKKAARLIGYIRSKHQWMTTEEGLDMGCPSCGNKAKYTQRRTIPVANVGDVVPDDALVVTYTGVTTSTMTKLGRGGQIYKYSGNPQGTFGPTFTIYARDINLFKNGPFSIQKAGEATRSAMKVLDVLPDLNIPPLPKKISKPEPVPITVAPPPIMEKMKRGVPSLDADPDAIIEYMDRKIEDSPDDFTKLGVSLENAGKLIASGFSVYKDLAECTPTEISGVIGTQLKESKRIKAAAAEMMGGNDGTGDNPKR